MKLNSMFKPRYTYCVKTDKGLENYSGVFESEIKALIWYAKHGWRLEQVFGRKLILTTRNDTRGHYAKSNI